MKMRVTLPLVIAAVALSGCGVLDRLKPRPKDTGAPLSAVNPGVAPSEPPLATEIAPAVETVPLGAAGQSPEALDTTTEVEKTEALTAPAAGGERELGRAVVALGSPADPGLWVQTALVTAPVQGRVSGPGGQSLAVELRPSSGAALMSLAAYQALGIGLTELPEVTIFGP